MSGPAKQAKNFYPRPPRGGRPNCTTPQRAICAISIHALREEGDYIIAAPTYEDAGFLSTPSARRATASNPVVGCFGSAFLSTPSARRATQSASMPCRIWLHFYPRPPRGGRLVGGLASGGNGGISIHALREEGDAGMIAVLFASSEFLSTPSARRATCRRHHANRTAVFLSTPSARRATCYNRYSDRCEAFLSTPSARRATHRLEAPRSRSRYFYPRPPRGGRPGITLTSLYSANFYPRPPRGGRRRQRRY